MLEKAAGLLFVFRAESGLYQALVHLVSTLFVKANSFPLQNDLAARLIDGRYEVIVERLFDFQHSVSATLPAGKK